MLKTETSLFIKDMERSIKDSRLFMLMSIKMNLQRANSIRDSDSRLKEISTLFLNYPQTDTLT
jgi:hypothetical protein